VGDSTYIVSVPGAVTVDVIMLVTAVNVLLVVTTAVAVWMGMERNDEQKGVAFSSRRMETISSTALQAADGRLRASNSGAGAARALPV
jgi:hypothetical protein